MRAWRWRPGPLTWREFFRRLWSQIWEDDVFGRAANLAYFFLLSLFPLLLFLTALIGYLPSLQDGLRHGLFEYLARVMPESAYALTRHTIEEISSRAGGFKLSLGLAGAVWAASNGMTAVVNGLNIAYRVPESRPWWKTRLLSIALTVTLLVMGIVALALVLYGDNIGRLIAHRYHLGDAFTRVWNMAHFFAAILFVLVVFSLIYHFAPNLNRQRWPWVLPGASVALGLWLLASYLFRVYLRFFDTYSKIYGSLGAVIVLMLWFYLTGLAILIGGEVNSVLERAASERES